MSEHEDHPAAAPNTLERHCARVGCSDEAIATLTADYTDRVMAVGPLSPEHEPQALDLCERHREGLTPPEGWELVRHTQR